MTESKVPTDCATTSRQKDMEWAKSFFDGYNQGLYGKTDCPIKIEVREPCKEVKVTATTIDIVSDRYWRSLPAFWLLRWAFWLGDFQVDIREE